MNAPSKVRHSFEEFKLYYESTEKVTDRRLETNRWNYSICIAILVAIATISNWSLATPKLLWVGLFADALLCVMAFFFCVLWIGQIRDFKNLNNAKFTVLNEMAPTVDFDIANPGAMTSFCPFDKEWAKLGEQRALDEVGSSNVIALKSSNIEYFIPKAFALLFAVILPALAFVVVSNWPPTTLAAEKPSASKSTSQ